MGSSMRKAAGSRTSARPMATRWRSPPLRCAGSLSSSGVMCSVSATSAHARHDGGLFQLPFHQREGEILPGGHVGEERQVLEDHGEVALLGPLIAHGRAADGDLAFVRRHQPQQQAENGRLARARRAEDAEELVVLDDEVDVLHGDSLAVVLARVPEFEPCHRCEFQARRGRAPCPTPRRTGGTCRAAAPP